jgi:hypothetical protein
MIRHGFGVFKLEIEMFRPLVLIQEGLEILKMQGLLKKNPINVLIA